MNHAATGAGVQNCIPKTLWPVPAEAAGKTKLNQIAQFSNWCCKNWLLLPCYKWTSKYRLFRVNFSDGELGSFHSALWPASCMFLMQWSGASQAELALLLPQQQLLKRRCSDLVLTKTSLAFQQDSEMWMLLLPVPWASWLPHFPWCCLHNQWLPLSSGHTASAAHQGLHTDRRVWGHGCGHTDKAAGAAAKQPKPSQRRPLLPLYTITNSWREISLQSLAVQRQMTKH